MSPGVRLERKADDAEAAAQKLLPVLRQKGLLRLSPADAAAASGLPLALCQDALLVLAKKQRASLNLGEGGELEFVFPSWAPPEEAFWAGRLAWYQDQWQKHHRWLLAATTAMVSPPILFWVSGNLLAWYSVPWLPEALAYAACVPAGICASLALVLWAHTWWSILLSAFLLTAWTGNYGWMTVGGLVLAYTLLFRASARLGSWANPQAAERRAAKRFDTVGFLNAARQAVRGILLGPLAPDPLEDERRLTAYVIAKGGVVGSGELMALMGWDDEAFGQALPRLLLDYGGELNITAKGGLICRFEALAKAQRAVAARATPLAEELQSLGLDPDAMGFKADRLWVGPQEALLESDLRLAPERVGPPRLWEAPGWAVLLALAVSILALGGLLQHPGLHAFPTAADWEAMEQEDFMLLYMQGQGVWPYLALLLPTCLRLPAWLARRWAHQRQKGFMALLATMARHPRGAWAHEVDARALSRLKGEAEVRDNAAGAMWVHFPRQASEARVLRRLRQEGGGTQELSGEARDQAKSPD